MASLILSEAVSSQSLFHLCSPPAGKGGGGAPPPFADIEDIFLLRFRRFGISLLSLMATEGENEQIGFDLCSKSS